MKKKQLTIRLIPVVDIQYEKLSEKAKMPKTVYIEDVLNKHAVQKEKEENILTEIHQLRESFAEVANVLEEVLKFVVENNKQQ
jgi:hypothetical protein